MDLGSLAGTVTKAATNPVLNPSIIGANLVDRAAGTNLLPANQRGGGGGGQAPLPSASTGYGLDLVGSPQSSAEMALQRQAIQQRDQRNADITLGLERAKNLVGENSMGRVGAELSPDQQRLLELRRSALQGLSAPELTAQREAMQRALASQQATSLRDLQRAQGGQVGGAAAAAQRARLLGGFAADRASKEQDLLLQNVGLRNQAVSDFEKSMMAAQQDQLARQQYNIAQANKEQLARLSLGYGEAGLGSAERSALLQAAVGNAMADATRASAGQQKPQGVLGQLFQDTFGGLLF